MMDKENTPVSAFYDSDEDFAWGPVSLREIKRNLKSKKKLDPQTYRRQTTAFIPLPPEDNTRMYTANSTQSSKDYFTANESMESNLKTTEKETTENTSITNSLIDTNKNSDKFVSMDAEPTEPSEVVSISSDSEDDIELPGSISVKKERITNNQLTEPNYSKINEESFDRDVICLSSSDEKSDLEYESITSHEGSSPTNISESDKEGKLNIDEMETENDAMNESIAHLHESVRDKQNDSMKDRVLNYFSSNYPVDQDFSLDYKGTDLMSEENINVSSKDSLAKNYTEGSQEVEEMESKEKEVSIKQMETEIEAINESVGHLHDSFSDKENGSVEDHALNYFSSNYPVDQDFISDYKGADSVPEKIINISSDVSSTKNCSEGLQENGHNQEWDEISDDSVSRQNIVREVNISQKENEYSYCLEKNETLSKQVSDYSSKYSENSSNSKYCYESDKFNESPVSPQSNSKFFSQDVDSIDETSEDLGNISLNDTFSEMQKLISQGYYSDSDDSADNIIESTPSKESKQPQEIFSTNHSRIPVPTHSSDVSISSVGGDFKVPKFPPKSIKKTPSGSKPTVPKTLVSPLKDIVSPVRLYIKNSPFSALKQNHKPGCSRTNIKFEDKSGNNTVSRRMHTNIKESLPEIIYKPSKIIEEKIDRKIILPNNIKSLIIDRTVIKHETRKRINLDDSVFTVGDKLKMQDLSHIVSDEHNMSVHTIKHGLNM